MQLTRINRMGMEFKILELKPGTLQVSTGNKKLDINGVSLADFDQAWYDWTQKGQYIQTAFHMIPADQREFLMTGTTPEEWAKMFPPEGDE